MSSLSLTPFSVLIVLILCTLNDLVRSLLDPSQFKSIASVCVTSDERNRISPRNRFLPRTSNDRHLWLLSMWYRTLFSQSLCTHRIIGRFTLVQESQPIEGDLVGSKTSRTSGHDQRNDSLTPPPITVAKHSHLIRTSLLDSGVSLPLFFCSIFFTITFISSMVPFRGNASVAKLTDWSYVM